VVPGAFRVRREARPPRAGILRVVLRGPGDRPVPGATGSLASVDAPDVDLVPEPRPSREDGVLAIGSLPPGRYALRVRAPGFRPRTLRALEVRAGAVTEAGKILLEPGLEVAGTVRDDGGSPIKGAEVTVRFFEEGRRLTAEKKTDADGRFRISGLPEGMIEIQGEAEGHLRGEPRAVEGGREDIEILLERTGSIAGRVADVRTGLPVTIFSVQLRPERRVGDLRDSGGSRLTEQEFEDEDGRFRIDGLRRRPYGVSVRARGFRAAERQGVEARAGTPEEMDLRLESGQAIEGTVSDARDRAPVPGATVRSEGAAPVSSDADGRFRLDGLGGGAVRIEVDHPAYLPEVMAEADPESGRPVEIRLHRGGAVEGTVYGMAGAVLPGAVVSTQVAGAERSSVADAAGRYRLDGMPPGWHILSKVNVPGTFEGYETASVEIRQEQTTAHDFGRGTRLHGVVTHQGAPASGALLTLAQDQEEMPPGARSSMRGSATIRAREDGAYEAFGLRPGTFGLLVTWEGRKAGRRITIPEETTEQRLDIDMPDLWLSGEVVDAENRRPLRARVYTIAKKSGGMYSFRMGDEGDYVEFSSNPGANGETDAAGRFRFQLLGPDVYRILASAEGYTLSEPVEVEVRDSVSGVVVELQPGIELTVTATDAATGQRVRLSCISVADAPPMQGRSSTCGSDVSTFGSRRPGPTIVAGSAAGFAPGYETVDLREAREEVALRLRRGGTLRLLLPAGAGSSVSAITSGLEITDASGLELTSFLRAFASQPGRWLDATGEDAALVRNVPPGRLTVSFGGEGTSLPLKSVDLDLPEGGEATADLR
jgi:hypothetical protein